MNGAELSNRGGSALSADRLQVDQDMFCGEGFSAQGEVSLSGTQIGGTLGFDGASLVSPGSPYWSTNTALQLADAHVHRDLVLRFGDRPVGLVKLTSARMGRLLDSERTWPELLQLRDCVYGNLTAEEDAIGSMDERSGFRWRLRRLWPRMNADVRRRLRWLRRVEDATDRFGQRQGYQPQPYTQLLGMYRAQGRDRDARRVAYARERRRRGELTLPGKTWNLFLQYTVGYGYRPWMAVLWLAGLLLIGSVLFGGLFDVAAAKAPAASDHPPQFQPVIYTLDLLVPVVNLRQRETWTPLGPAQWWAFTYTVLGWALTTAVVTGITAAVRRD